MNKSRGGGGRERTGVGVLNNGQGDARGNGGDREFGDEDENIAHGHDSL